MAKNCSLLEGEWDSGLNCKNFFSWSRIGIVSLFVLLLSALIYSTKTYIPKTFDFLFSCNNLMGKSQNEI